LSELYFHQPFLKEFSMKTIKNYFGASLIAVAAILSGQVSAAVVGVGSSDGGDCTFGCVVRYQQVYRASLFGAGPVNISEVDFFAYSSPISGSRSFSMVLSTSNNPVGALSLTFASNLGADQVAFATSTFSGNPNLNDLLAFTGSFNYDPTAGDLLVDIVSLDVGDGGPPYLMASTNPGDFDRAYSFSSTVNADSANNNGYANRTQFVFGLQQNNVPEPATVLLLGFGLLAIVGTRRKVSAA
jgi:PEP-CTERM motif